MDLRWIKYQDHAVGGKYTLRQVIRSSPTHGVFAADGAVVHLVPEDLPEGAQRLQEWSVASRLSHPNLLRVLETGRAELDDMAFVYGAFEPADDRLIEVVRDRPLNSEEAKQVLKSCAEALSYLHAQGLAHNNVAAENIVAVGENVKLTSDSVTPADADRQALDIQALGATVVEILTQERPASLAEAQLDDLDEPFRRIAAGCAGGWSAERVLGELGSARAQTNASVDAESSAPASRSFPWWAVAAAFLVAVLIVWAARTDEPSQQAATPVAPAESAARPAPVPIPAKPANVRSADTSASRSRTSRSNGSGWTVVAGIYSNYDAAERRSRSLQSRSPDIQPFVVPPKGQGRRYLVALGSGLTKSDADRLRRRAVAAGFPRDTYVTKLDLDPAP